MASGREAKAPWLTRFSLSVETHATKGESVFVSISFLQRLGQCCCFTFQADTIFIKGYLNLICQDADIGKRERKEGEH